MKTYEQIKEEMHRHLCANMPQLARDALPPVMDSLVSALAMQMAEVFHLVHNKPTFESHLALEDTIKSVNDFMKVLGSDPVDPGSPPKTCHHSWKKYCGIVEQYEFCEYCDAKRS